MPVASSVSEETSTPEKMMGDLADPPNAQLADDIFDVIYGTTPSFFENLAVDLLMKMGYSKRPSR
jgi:restriction endonuclease Mrr